MKGSLQMERARLSATAVLLATGLGGVAHAQSLYDRNENVPVTARRTLNMMRWACA